METPVDNAEVHSSFAGALAAFAMDVSGMDDKNEVANRDGLADDVATFSYEHVLRTHSRFKAGDLSVAEGGGTGAPARDSVVPDREHKSASVTIRMGHAECAQLRKRAAAANLTVSAYMRSCILEAETLRAQVKEALAELRAATPEETRRGVTHAPRRWWRPWPHAGSRSAQA